MFVAVFFLLLCSPGTSYSLTSLPSSFPELPFSSPLCCLSEAASKDNQAFSKKTSFQILRPIQLPPFCLGLDFLCNSCLTIRLMTHAQLYVEYSSALFRSATQKGELISIRCNSKPLARARSRSCSAARSSRLSGGGLGRTTWMFSRSRRSSFGLAGSRPKATTRDAEGTCEASMVEKPKLRTDRGRMRMCRAMSLVEQSSRSQDSSKRESWTRSNKRASCHRVA